MNVDFSALVQAIVNQLVIIVPALGVLAGAWIAHRIALFKAVKRETAAAEKVHGAKKGPDKHARVKRVIKQSWTVRNSTLDKLIREAADTIPPEAG